MIQLHWRDVSPDGVGPPIQTSLTGAEANELRRLAEGKRVLEIGSAYGFSTIVMAQVARQVVSIDPHQALNSFGILKANLASYGVTSRVVVWVGSSPEVLLDWEAQSFDLAFIDGDHTTAAVQQDILQAMRLVRSSKPRAMKMPIPGGMIAVHDYAEIGCPEVAPVVNRLLPEGYLVDTLWVSRR